MLSALSAGAGAPSVLNRSTEVGWGSLNKAPPVPAANPKPAVRGNARQGSSGAIGRASGGVEQA